MYYTYNSLWWFFWFVPLALFIIGTLVWSTRRTGDPFRPRYYDKDDYDSRTDAWRMRRDRSRRSLRGKGPRNYRRPDARILEDVNDCLLLCEDLDATDIEAHVTGGTVQLEGHVESRSDKRLAEALADGVAGVADVDNRLRIGRAPQPASADLGAPAPSGQP